MAAFEVAGTECNEVSKDAEHNHMSDVTAVLVVWCVKDNMYGHDFTSYCWVTARQSPT